MPKYEIRKGDLERLVGRSFTLEELEDVFFDIKAELDDVDGDLITVEYSDTNRPDMWSVEGLAREIRGYLGLETGCPKYAVGPPAGELRVDPSVKKIRPFVAAAVVRGVRLGEEGYEQLIQLQEKIMLTYGRKRRRVAIGTHNADMISFPVKYSAVDPESVRFVPLWETRELTLSEILEKTEKGREYAHLLDGFDKYPVIVDDNGRVISFPPIINSNDIGNIGPQTRDVFVDVTGTNRAAVMTAVNVIAAALAERGGKIESVRIVYPDEVVVTPNMAPKQTVVRKSYVERISGIQLSEPHFKELLERARYDVLSVSGDEWSVAYPSYRSDIMHERDVAEDVIIAYGYNRVEPKFPGFMTKGGASKYTELENAVKDILVGTTAQEIATFTLTSRTVVEKARHSPVVVLQNPVTETFSIVRPALLPTVMDFLSANTGEDYPQLVFEVGDVVVSDNRSPTGTRTEQHVCYAIAGSGSTYTDIRQVMEYLLDQLGLQYSFQARDYPWYVPGRSAAVSIGGDRVGHIGEVHPSVLEDFGIGMPVAAFELNLRRLLEAI